MLKILDGPTVSLSIIDIVKFEISLSFWEVAYDYFSAFSICYNSGKVVHILSFNRSSLPEFLKELNTLIILFFECLNNKVISDFSFQDFNYFQMLALCYRVFIFNLQSLNMQGEVSYFFLLQDFRICFF